MIYLDHSATTRPLDEVVEAVAEVMRDYYGNPSSLHKIGIEAEKLLNRSRSVIAHTLQVRPEQIIFTSGGTESNNLAIRGAALAARTRGNHLITTRTEHSSVYECFRQLEKEGFRVTYLPVDQTGGVSLESLMEKIDKETTLVSVMHVNNETGRIQPVREIGEQLQRHPYVRFHVDAVQAVGNLPINPNEWGIDLMTVSAHKLGGPKGAGVLVRRENMPLTPLFAGGGQEFGLRPGTENVPVIVGMAKAIRIACTQLSARSQRTYALRARLIERTRDIAGLHLTGGIDQKVQAPHIVHFTLSGIRSEVALHALEQHEIYVSTRSACASGETEPSRVLLAMGMNRKRAARGIRITLSPSMTEAEIDVVADHLRDVVTELRGGHER